MTDYGFLSLIPPVLAIFLAIRTKQVIFSLLLGISIGWIIINGGNLFLGLIDTVEAIINVFSSAGNTRTVVFTLLIGALIQLIKFSGGMDGFIGLIQKKLSETKNPKRNIQLAASITGFLIFIESNISILAVGTAYKPIFARYKIAKEKLAYLADSSSAPSCILFPLNAWGAYIMGLMMVYENLDPFKMLAYSIPFNFYPIITLIFLFYLAFTGKSFGPMRSFECKVAEEITHEKPTDASGNPHLMIWPLAAMVFSMPLFLIYTGWKNSLTDDLKTIIEQYR